MGFRGTGQKKIYTSNSTLLNQYYLSFIKIQNSCEFARECHTLGVNKYQCKFWNLII